MASKLAKRFEELTEQLAGVNATKKLDTRPHAERGDEVVDAGLLLGWTVKAKHLLETACGKNSQHFREFENSEKGGAYTTSAEILDRLGAVFMAAQEDFLGGYLSSVRTLVQAEVFDSELEQARELLQNGYQTPAAVITGIVLETALRELCDRSSIAHGKLDRMNAELAKAGVYTLLVQKQITALAQIRNDAAHGKPNGFTTEDVTSMIADVQRILAFHLV